MENKHTSEIHIAIAEPQLLFRELLCRLIDSFGGFVIDAEASDGDELIKKLKRLKTKPDICIFDISMPRKNGYETLKEIRTQWPELHVLILTAVSNPQAVRRMYRDGANGYLLITSHCADLKKALLSICKNGDYYSEFTSKIMHHTNNADDRTNINDAEFRFLSFVANDCDYREIAAMMEVSARTVEGYRDSLFDKLKVHSRTGLVMHAASMGLAYPKP